MSDDLDIETLKNLANLLGNPSEKLTFAVDKAVELSNRLRVAHSSERVAWEQANINLKLAENAVDLLKDLRRFHAMDREAMTKVDNFLGPAGFKPCLD